MAYDSDEWGRVEVYAQSYPNASVKRWKVSPANGSEPMWTRGGRELVYRKGDSVMAVSVDVENGRSARPERCSRDRILTTPGGPARAATTSRATASGFS